MSQAEPSQILVSRTVRDLVGGSDIALVDAGTRRLKGIDGEWQLFAVADGNVND
jgi:class 3 adenylate cyclase